MFKQRKKQRKKQRNRPTGYIGNKKCWHDKMTNGTTNEMMRQTIDELTNELNRRKQLTRTIVQVLGILVGGAVLVSLLLADTRREARWKEEAAAERYKLEKRALTRQRVAKEQARQETRDMMVRWAKNDGPLPAGWPEWVKSEQPK